jgi:peroxiredoxin
MSSSKWTKLVVAAALIALPGSLSAELSTGRQAPNFVTQGALAGKSFNFDLKQALKKGPVVLYFYPKAFTEGCTLEAQAFADATPDFAAAGATVVGMSADDLPTLERFSTEHCRDKFAVAMASKKVISDYDVAFVMNGKDTGVSSRTSYVIDTDGSIKLAYSAMDWREHVSRTLAEVRKLKAS